VPLSAARSATGESRTAAGSPAAESPAGAVPRPGLGAAFWRLWAATGVSSLGDGAVLVGFPLLAYGRTHTAVLIAGVVVAGRLPAVLLSLPAGALADRWSRRRLAVGVELVRLVLLAAFGVTVVAGADSLGLIYATVFAVGACETLFVCTTSAVLPAVVPVDRLVEANGYLLLADLTGEEVAGQGLGGLAYAAARALPFVADAVSFLASAVLLNRALPPDDPPRPPATLRADLVAGLRWFAGHRAVRLLAVLLGSFAFCQYLVAGVLVVYARRTLGLGGSGYGLFLAVAAAGDVVGALAARRVHARLGPGPSIAAAGAVAGGAYLLLAAVPDVAVAATAVALQWAAVAVGNVAAVSLRQRLVPAALLGRVTSAFRALVYAGMPVGALAGGVVASTAGLRSTFLLAGGLQVVAVATLGVALARRLRHPADPEPTAGTSAAGTP
jgi:predicted MFS family arabinose efflux permease